MSYLLPRFCYLYNDKKRSNQKTKAYFNVYTDLSMKHYKTLIGSATLATLNGAKQQLTENE